MKNLLQRKSVKYLFLSAVGIVLLQSCAVYSTNRYRPVTVADIVQMSKDKVPSEKIINSIRKSQTVYNLKADQIASLAKEGVSNSVLNYMEKTHIDAVRHNQRLEDSRYWWPGWDGYMYGGPAFGWPENYQDYNWGPDINFGEDDEGDDNR